LPRVHLWGRRRAVLTIALGAVVGAIAAPATSFAATVEVAADQAGAPPRLIFKDAGAETNTATIDLSGCGPAAGLCTGGTYTVTDTSSPLTAIGPECSGGPTTVSCIATGTSRIGVRAGGGNDTVTVNAKPPRGTSIAGEDGDDILNGGPATDFIRGGPGADTIDAGPGDDDIDPGTVTPVDPATYDADSCNFHVPGVPCPDKVEGGLGYNTVRFASEPGAVIVDERSGTSNQVTDESGFLLVKELTRVAKVVGTQYDDQIYGGVVDDWFVGGGGADVLCGGLGFDTVDYSGSPGPVNVSLDGILAPDSLWQSALISDWGKARHDCRQRDENDPLGTPIVDAQHPQDCSPNDGGADDVDPNTDRKDCVGPDIENIIGSPYDDVLVGNSPGAYVDKAAFFEPRGMNVLEGRGGNDVLDGRGGADVLIGGDNGPQGDTVDYSWETSPVAVTIDGAASDGSSADLNSDSGLGDSVATDVENIVGGSGDDTLGGSSGPNSISGGPGNDTLQGGGGDDVLDGQDGNDTVQGDSGADQVHGGPGDDALVGGTGGDLLDGGDGSDTVDYSDANTPVFAAPDGLANDGVAQEGDNVADTVEGLLGGSSNDLLVGNGGNGILSGGAGDDILDGGGGSDAILGGDGLDTASYAGRTASVSVDLAASGGNGEAGENDVIAGDVESVTGGQGNDTIAGRDDTNILMGGGGNDTIDGRGADDQVFGGAGNDTEMGGAGADKLAGDDGADNLQGGADADALDGGAGDDSLDGGPGSDVVAGGPGKDAAVYSTRSKTVAVTLDGADNDGESKEGDQIRATTEGARTGSGNDKINVKDGVAGAVSCGKGRDTVTADTVDVIADDCENVGVSSVCSVRARSATMSRKGVVRLRVTCLASVKATLTLQTAGAYKAAKKTRKKVKLGRKKFSLKAGRSKTVKVKLSKKARRLVKRNKKLRAKATISAKRAATAKATKRSKKLMIKAPKKKKKGSR
jgi:Ca2+-binding RTX toxin-like protein